MLFDKLPQYIQGLPYGESPCCFLSAYLHVSIQLDTDSSWEGGVEDGADKEAKNELKLSFLSVS